MAEYIPGTSVTRSAAMSALHHAPKAPDDNDVDVRNSVMNVDYLSHEWQEEADVWASWRHTTRHKYDLANGVRLENASWRTWWKQRNNLKTISPETLNWLKDSDVTWLYGPLHTAAEPVPPLKVATTEDRLDLVKANGKKPILKHRSISELLTDQRAASPLLEAITADLADDHDDRPPIQQTKSESHIGRGGSRRVSPPRVLALGRPSSIRSREESESPRIVGSDSEGSGPKKHISFNTFVEQCIAIDKPRTASYSNNTRRWEESSDTAYEDDRSNYDDDDDDAVLTMRSSSSSGHSSRASSIRRPSITSRSSSMSEHVTIAPIAPTMLKTLDFGPGESPAIVFVPPQGSPFLGDPSAIHRYSGQATLRLGATPTPPATHGAPNHSQWNDEDEDRGVGFDYFDGPDTGANNLSRSSNGRGPIPDRGREHTIVPSGQAQYTPPRTTSGTLPSAQAGRTPSHSSSRTSNNGPGRSILKQSLPDTAGAALPDASEKPDTYFSNSPASVPSPPSLRNQINTNQATFVPSSKGFLVPDASAPSRGRSATRTGNVERERSSSKGSSPIGSVSPSSSRPQSVLGRPIVKAVNIGAHPSLDPSKSTSSPPPATNGGSSPSSARSISSKPIAKDPADGMASIRAVNGGGNVPSSLVEKVRQARIAPASSSGSTTSSSSRSSQLEVLPEDASEGPSEALNGFKKRSPHQKTERRKVSIDIVPILPTATSDVGVNGMSIPKPPYVTRDRSYDRSNDEDGEPDGTDGYQYHSTNPTPSNSPTLGVKTLLPSSPQPPVPVPVPASSPTNPIKTTNHTHRKSPSLSGARTHQSGTSVETEDGNLVTRAAEIVSSARGLFGAIWNAGVGHPASPVESYSSVNGRKASDG